GLGRERLLPTLLQLAGHQPVLRLDRVVLACRAVRLVRRPLHLLAPMLVEAPPLLLQVFGRRQAQLQRRRLQDAEHQPFDQLVDRAAADPLTDLAAVIGVTAGAGVTQAVRAAAVLYVHPPAAPPADQQPAQQRGTFPRRPLGVGAAAVVRQAFAVGLVPFPSDVRGAAPFEQHLAL